MPSCGELPEFAEREGLLFVSPGRCNQSTWVCIVIGRPTSQRVEVVLSFFQCFCSCWVRLSLGCFFRPLRASEQDRSPKHFFVTSGEMDELGVQDHSSIMVFR